MGMVGTEAKEGAVMFTTNTAVNPVNLDERIKLKERFVIPVFGTLVLSQGLLGLCMNTVYDRECLQTFLGLSCNPQVPWMSLVPTEDVINWIN